MGWIHLQLFHVLFHLFYPNPDFNPGLSPDLNANPDLKLTPDHNPTPMLTLIPVLKIVTAPEL
jgi:hypothetical protein